MCIYILPLYISENILSFLLVCVSTLGFTITTRLIFQASVAEK